MGSDRGGEGAPRYYGLVSARSRRLRTIGVVLLAALILGAIYGGLFLMPSLRAARHVAGQLRISAGRHTTANPAQLSSSANARADHLRKAFIAQLIFAYAYWTMELLLFVAVVLVAWLDLREVTASYAEARRRLWNDSANRLRERPEDLGSE